MKDYIIDQFRSRAALIWLISIFIWIYITNSFANEWRMNDSNFELDWYNAKQIHINKLVL